MKIKTNKTKTYQKWNKNPPQQTHTHRIDKWIFAQYLGQYTFGTIFSAV